MSAELLLGDEAAARGAMDAGIAGAFSYPGTPATEILEYVQQRAATSPAVQARWSTNEKVAYEQALGMSYAGRRALVAMKHVGLNVAADPFMSSSITGVRGGLVLAVADDPGMHSSQNEQDSREYARFAGIPLFEPADQQETYDMARAAFDLSEQFELPVMLRLVTRLAHSRANVRPREPRNAASRDRPVDWRDWTLVPSNARRRYRRLLDMQADLAREAERSPFNTLELRGPRGIVACGLGANYVREALGDRTEYSLLKIGAYPVPVGMLRTLVDHCTEVLVVEDGYPVVEASLAGLLGLPGKLLRGRLTGDLPRDGEMSADLVRRALRLPAVPTRALDGELPMRPPQLCQGCPHCATFRAITDAATGGPRPFYFSDIGCYALAAFPPYSAVDTCVDMGASIGMGHGAALAGAHPVICTIGDSTFVHSGITPLISAIHDNANMTVLILDNAAVAMTGGQEVFVSGDRLMKLVAGLGVPSEHLLALDPLPKAHERNVEILRREINHHGLSVLIASRPCIQIKRRVAQRDKAEPVAAAE